MINESTEDTSKNLAEIKKEAKHGWTIQKRIRFPKNFQAEIQDIKNYIKIFSVEENNMRTA